MILNRTTDELIDIEVKCADNFYMRLKGLMGKKNIDYGLLFTNLAGSSVHTSFIRFEIDIYFLDENQIVFDKVRLKPWRFYRPKKGAKYILEVKDKLKIKIGDEIEFI